MNEFNERAFEIDGASADGFRCRGEKCRHYDECEHTAETCRHTGGRGDRDFHGEHGPHGDRDFHGEHGPHGDHDFHGPHGDHDFHGGRGTHHARRPEYLQDDSLRSLLIRSAQSMHHPRAGASQELVLQILARQAELDQRALGLEMAIRPGSLSELVSKLEQKGLVERERSDADRRRVMLRLTEAGRAALTPGGGEAEDPFYPLTAEEQETLRALLTKLLSVREDG